MRIDDDDVILHINHTRVPKKQLPVHNCFIALSCDAPESKKKLKGHQISEKCNTNEEVK